MKTIGVVLHPAKPAAARAEQSLRTAAESRGIDVEEAAPGGSYDLIVALGGDGTVLRAAALAAPAGVPLLAVNLGRFGYLASIEPDRIEEAVDAVTDGKCVIDRRMMIVAETSARGEEVRTLALNEIVIDRESPSRVIRVEVAVGAQLLATYTVDGFIVSTPTGSTAYSLSAGGPILEPGIEAMVLTPVSPHWPLWRSVVVGPGSQVELRLSEGGAFLAADGRNVTSLDSGAAIRVTRFPEPLQLLHLGDYSFFERIRSRFSMEPKRKED